MTPPTTEMWSADGHQFLEAHSGLLARCRMPPVLDGVRHPGPQLGTDVGLLGIGSPAAWRAALTKATRTVSHPSR
jgi:hypothetical protein